VTRVDSKGRIVLPKDLREQLGISAGTEVEVRKEGGKAVIEPEPSPESFVEELTDLISTEATNRDGDRTPYEEMHPTAQAHADAVRRGAAKADDSRGGDDSQSKSDTDDE
jgi:AbrB family looped-hinge helix DNA binding protein